MSLIANNARAALRFTVIFVWVFVAFLPATFLHYAGFKKPMYAFVQLFYHMISMIFGLRIEVRGMLDKSRPLLLTSNHTTYLDIPVLGSLGHVSFTPKREIRDWPLIGFLAVLADCVFIERRPAYMQQAAAEMREKLAQGKVLSIFGEGTTTDGIHIKPFKSGFFELAIEQHLPVQPISIAYTHFGQRRIADDKRDELAWVGDATLVQHLWHVLGQPYVRVVVHIHPVIPADSFSERKSLTLACETQVKSGVAQMMEESKTLTTTH